MSTNTVDEARRTEVSTFERERTIRTTRALLTCAVVAGPLFLAVAFVQAVARSGFSLSEHPLSLLSLGDLGWIQITNFVVAGLLYAAGAIGFRRALPPGRGVIWIPRLLGAFGASLIAGGAFVADPAYGFPPGTPEGSPDDVTWHGVLHGIAPVVGFLALIAACFVFARRSADAGEHRWARSSVAVGVAVLVLSASPSLSGDPDGTFVPLWIAIVLALAWASLVAARSRAR